MEVNNISKDRLGHIQMPFSYLTVSLFGCKYTTRGVAKVVTPPILLIVFKKKT